jgi:uncharacterized radical SAM superfamily Fe-S cluster-containing enzyme
MTTTPGQAGVKPGRLPILQRPTETATSGGRVLQVTESLCPVCLRMLNATLEVVQNDVWMRKQCPEHGPFAGLYWRDAAFFEKAQRRIHTHNVCENAACARGEVCHDHWDRTTTIMVNVTERCNYDCPICFSESGAGREDMTLEALDQLLPPARAGQMPNVVFVGGEPTVHNDLPAMIRLVSQRGYIPRLVTNGSRLLKKGYLDKLYASGLRWVVLQFDGFSDEIHQKLRRRNLLDMKPRVIAAVNAAGMRLQLATMVECTTNLDQVGPIVRYALDSGDVFWCSTYPHSSINKNQTDDHQTHVIDVMRSLSDDLGGQVTPDDFLESMDVFRRLAAVRRDRHLNQKLSIYPIVLFREGDRVVPINRLMGVRGIWKHRATAWSILTHLRAYLNFETHSLPRGTLFFTIEKFHNDDTIDLREASQCHMSYVTPRGLVPFDIYNTYYRKTHAL